MLKRRPRELPVNVQTTLHTKYPFGTSGTFLKANGMLQQRPRELRVIVQTMLHTKHPFDIRRIP